VDSLIVGDPSGPAYRLAIEGAPDYENLQAAVLQVYSRANPQILAQRIAEALTLAELAAMLGITDDYPIGESLLHMQTESRWRLPRFFTDAAAKIGARIAKALDRIPGSEVEVTYEFGEKPQKRAPQVAAAVQLDTASRLRAKAEHGEKQSQPLQQTKGEMFALLRELGCDPNPPKSNPIITEEVQTRFSRARETILSLDFYRAAYPYWRYSSVLDDRTTTGCRKLDGLTMPASDPRWVGFVPPRHWNCRSHVLAVVHSEGVKAKKTAPDEEYAGDGSFGTLKDEWEPKPGSYPSDLWDIYAAAKDIASPHIELEGKWWRKKAVDAAP